jgi:hypothetical protein
MDGTTPLIATGPSKPAKKLDKAEKLLAGLLIGLGFLLIVGVLIWFAASTDNGSLVSKEVTTSEPAGQGATGQKTVEETNYADGVVIFALTIGAVMTLSGAFFGRIREIKFNGVVISMDAPEEVANQAQKTAEEKAKQEATTPEKETAAAALAGSMAKQQIGFAYATAPAAARSAVADAVGTACAATAVRTVES